MAAATPGITHIEDPGGRRALQLESDDARVVIALTGAQVLSWLTPRGDVLWTASYPEFAPNKPVRGGIPLVFPWFGDHPDRRDLPAHGFARNLDWRCTAEGPGPVVVLSTNDDDATRAMWPHRFGLELTVALATELKLTLGIENRGDATFRCEHALHTYFAVGDVRQATVHGLEGLPCVEQATDGEGAWDHAAPLHFRAETDRIFQDTPDALTLRAPALDRTVRLTTVGAKSAIVWNPWIAKAARLSQLDPADWRRFCCIEAANVREHAIDVAPGQRHVLELRVACSAAG